MHARAVQACTAVHTLTGFPAIEDIYVPLSVFERLARYLVDGALERPSEHGAKAYPYALYDPISSRSTPYNQLFTTLIRGQQLPTEPLGHHREAQGGRWWTETVTNLCAFTHPDPVQLCTQNHKPNIVS